LLAAADWLGRITGGSLMQADTYELKQVMTPERRYVIPTFQRDYEWTERGQWALLFEDLDSVADRLGQARAYALATDSPTARAEKAVAPHFLGAVVCDQLPTPAGGLDMRAVIDGQQRLTTLQLLIRGVLDVLIERDSPRVKQVRRLLENPTDVIERPEEKHKLWPRRRDRLVWPVAMGDASPSATDHPYLKARKFFGDATRRASIGVDGTDRIDHLVDALLSLFKLVVIDLEDNDDAQVIFEVLNGRQTPLSASDLVKNLLFLRGELAEEKELERLYDEYWAEFDEDWWKKQVGTGHAARGRRDVLLSVWLTAVSGREANVGHLYGEARAYLKASNRKTEDVLSELHAYGHAYKTIYAAFPAETPILARTYRRLDQLKILTVVPLLAWLRTLPSSRILLPDHERAVCAIESWVIRRMIIGANTRGYNTAFVNVLQAAQHAAKHPESNIADAIVDSLAQAPNSLEWPNDRAIEHAFANSRFYNVFTQERIRLILGALDEQMQLENPKAEPAAFEYWSLQIEHVMPQGWRDHWPIERLTGVERVMAETERDDHVHRLGNLTLVTPSFNQSLSNSAWVEKRREFIEQSKVQLSTAIACCETWYEGAIRERGSALAGVACRVWPAPASSNVAG